LCRIGAASAGGGAKRVRGLRGGRVDDDGLDTTTALLDVCIERGFDTGLNVGACGVCCFIDRRIGADWGADWAREAVVHVSRGSRKRGNSATGLEFAIGGICRETGRDSAKVGLPYDRLSK
jgi:hypothetical protein